MKNQIHRTNFIRTALCAASLTAATAFAANSHPALRERGTVESIDAKEMKLTIKDTQSHAAQVFAWNQQTQFIERGGHAGKPSTVAAGDLKQGDEVSIRYEKENDRLMARQVVISHEHRAPAKAARPAGG